MRILSIVGHKNSGKTTLLVALAREFKRQGKQVGTLKHASHPAIVDREGKDTYRHYYEGCAERTMIVSPDLRVLFEREADRDDPETLARRYMQGLDLVLVEGFKRESLPKVEVYRRQPDLPTLFESFQPNTADWVAIVTDDAGLDVPCRVLRFQDTMWLPLLSALVWERARVIAP